MPSTPEGRYNIANVTRDLQREFALFDRDGDDVSDENTATPEHLAVLLAALRDMTDGLELRRDNINAWLPDAAVRHWDRTMLAWKSRLGRYEFEVAKAPPGDREDVLWSVTAPLLLGFFGGPDSKLPQQPLDAVTPFSLANGLDIDDAWRAQTYRALKADLAKGAEDVADVAVAALDFLPVVVVGGLGLLGLRWALRGRR